MDEHVYKKVTVIGASDQGIDDAISLAIQKASKSLRNMSWFEVKEIRGSIQDTKVQNSQVVLEIGFRLE